MAAHKGQGASFAVFLTGLTVVCAGIAYSSSGLGKLLLVVGIVILAGSLVGLLRIKPLEGKPAQKPGAGAMKAIGALAALGGWLVTLAGLHLTPSNGGRIGLALVGIGISLFGMIYILPAAFNKNAIWKA
jgi:hypothetical protein